MLTRLIATIAALTLIGLATALPALAQSGGDSSGADAAAPTATATATSAPTATPVPVPAAFTLESHIEALKPRALTRLGGKWYVGGSGTGYIYIFSNAGTYERRIKAPAAEVRGLADDGTNLIAVSGGVPRIYKWAPQANETDAVPAAAAGFYPALPKADRSLAQGVAYDGANTWVAVSWPTTGAKALTRHALLKVSGSTVATRRVDAQVDSLVHENRYLYGVLKDHANTRLARLPLSALSGTTGFADWKAVKQSAGIRNGLEFLNGVAYGFNSQENEVRRERQPSPERLFSLTPHTSKGENRANDSSRLLSPRGLTRLDGKWYVAGYSGPGRIHVFSGDGTYERRLGLADITQGITNDGTNLIAVSGRDRVYTWNPTTDSQVSLATLPKPPDGGEYRSRGVAHDGANTWVAAFSTSANRPTDLVKLSATGTLIYRTNASAKALVHKEDGYLYGIAAAAPGVNWSLVRIKISDLQPYPPASSNPPINNWETVRSDIGIKEGLAFHDGKAYGFNFNNDEVRLARQPSPERLFSLHPHISKPNSRINDRSRLLSPRGLTRLDGKWYVAGYSGPGRIHVFSDDGTFHGQLGLADVTQGITNDGTNLIAVSGRDRVYTWSPSSDSLVSVEALPNAPGGGQYRARAIARDGADNWVAVYWPPDATTPKRALIKTNATETLIYRTNVPVKALVHQSGYLYGIAPMPSANSLSPMTYDLVRIKISDLKPYTVAALFNLAEPPMNNWEPVRSDIEIKEGLTFHNGVAYGFNTASDEVRRARGGAVIATTPPAPNPATPSSGADANPSG